MFLEMEMKKFKCFSLFQFTYKSANSEWNRNRSLSVLHISATARRAWEGEEKLILKKNKLTGSVPPPFKVILLQL